MTRQAPHRDNAAQIAAYAASVRIETESTRHLSDAAALLSSATYRDLAAQRPTDAIQRLLRVLSSAAVSADATLADTFDDALARLVRDYRNEYVFKNAIVSKVVFGRHRPTTASAVLELPLGSSFADVAVFNGTSTVYEIKTDLDSFARLQSQVADYQTRMEYVYLVISEDRAAIAERRLPERVGLVALTKSGSLRTVRHAESNRDVLRSDHIFRMLRQAEAEAVVAAHGVALTETDPVARWRRLRDEFAALPTDAAHAGAVAAFRRRGEKIVDVATDTALPKSIRALAYSAPLSGAAKARLLTRLAMPVALLRGS